MRPIYKGTESAKGKKGNWFRNKSWRKGKRNDGKLDEEPKDLQDMPVQHVQEEDPSREGVMQDDSYEEACTEEIEIIEEYEEEEYLEVELEEILADNEQDPNGSRLDSNNPDGQEQNQETELILLKKSIPHLDDEEVKKEALEEEIRRIEEEIEKRRLQKRIDELKAQLESNTVNLEQNQRNIATITASPENKDIVMPENTEISIAETAVYDTTQISTQKDWPKEMASVEKTDSVTNEIETFLQDVPISEAEQCQELNAEDRLVEEFDDNNTVLPNKEDIHAVTNQNPTYVLTTQPTDNKAVETSENVQQHQSIMDASALKRSDQLVVEVGGRHYYNETLDTTKLTWSKPEWCKKGTKKILKNQSGAQEKSPIQWEKPTWTKELPLKSTGKTDLTNLAKPITFPEGKGDAINLLAQPNEVLERATPVEKKSIGWERPDWAKDKEKVFKKKGVTGDEKQIEWSKPDWTQQPVLKTSGKGEALKQGAEISRPITLRIETTVDQ